MRGYPVVVLSTVLLLLAITTGTASARTGCAGGDGYATCHWIVQQCDKWFDKSDRSCLERGTIDSDKELGQARWSRYYCACDTKCYPDDAPNPCYGSDNMVSYHCAKTFGPQDCPPDRICRWDGTDTKGTRCPAKCCGGFCVWKKC